jgi:hypothetical protein
MVLMELIRRSQEVIRQLATLQTTLLYLLRTNSAVVFSRIKIPPRTKECLIIS